MILSLLILAVVVSTFLLGRYQERARTEDEELKALRRIHNAEQGKRG